MQNYPRAELAASVLGIAMLGAVCAKSAAARSMPGMVFLWAGAVGNLLGRLTRGYAVDWIYIGWYINLADVWIGVGCLMICAQCIHINRRRVLQ
jgi:lipoprotein signal peptidase